MAAALLCMVAALTLGRKRYEAVQAEVQRIQRDAEALQQRAERLAQADIAAYDRVSAALTLPRSSEDETARRRERLQEALQGAVGPPLDTMETAAEVARLAAELAAVGNRSAISDVGTAALAARAGFEAAQLNVEINLAAIRNEDWKAGIRRRVAELGNPAASAAAALEQVRRAIQGEAS